jgi:hypothetical protein
MIQSFFGGFMMFANASFGVTGVQEIPSELLSGISGGAYFWDDLAGGTVSSRTDTVPTTTNLIPLPRGE